MSNTQSQKSAYLSFVATLRSKAAELGIPLVETQGTETGLPENKGWVRFESAVNGHKVYVPKSETKMGMCETTLPALHLNGARDLGAKRDGVPRVNGKIVARFTPDVETIASTLLPMLADPADRLPANAAPGTRKAR